MLSLLLLLAAAEPATAPVAVGAPATVTPVVATTLVEPNPATMNQREIRAYNTTLTKAHPFYIRCISSIQIGTLAKRNYTCRTNRQWALADEEGNRNARESIEGIQSRGSTNETALGAAP